MGFFSRSDTPKTPRPQGPSLAAAHALVDERARALAETEAERLEAQADVVRATDRLAGAKTAKLRASALHRDALLALDTAEQATR
jgi:hypothetical protein